MIAATDGSIRVRLSSPRASRSLEGLLFPDTYQVSPTRRRPGRPADGRPDGARRPPGEIVDEGLRHSVCTPYES